MKIAISYPPLESEKGIPLLAQNRQFQFAHSPWTAYPIIPASAATLLKQAGFEVFWDDAINEGLKFEQWQTRLLKENPDIVAIETKTPVIKRHWKIINELKTKNYKLKTVLMGDHVTALPQESMDNCRVDYILTGGDYDFMLLNLANHLTKGEKLEPGWWFRDGGNLKDTGQFVLNHDLDSLPLIDRNLAKWKLYAFKNSNFTLVPGTFSMAGRDCWWRNKGGCSFCSWTAIFPQFRVVKSERLLDEIGQLIELGVKEVFDDTGTFPVGPWLEDFCRGMIDRGYNKKIRFGCNMRANAIVDQETYDLMGKASFGFILYGLESANQETLDRLNKGEKEGDIVEAVKMAKRAGLNPHVTCMIGYPWEKKEQAQKTVDLTRQLFKQGYIDSLQATIVTPYPGTALFAEADKEGWLKTKDWDRYDMREPILKTEMADEETLALVRSLYKSIFSFEFFIRKLKEGLSSPQVFSYYWRLSLKFFSKLADFRQRP
ncbi:MAG: radical SAM protein [bacterium]|nr:radical SAM protein [bacterium]